MTDDLEALQSTRANVDPPSAAHPPRGARAGTTTCSSSLPDAPGRRDRRRGAPAFALRTAIAATVAVAIVAGAWAVTRSRINSVKPSHVIAVGSLAGAGADDPQVFLLIGSDSRAFVNSPGQQQQFGDPTATAGERSDTMVLVRLDPGTKHVLVVSIPARPVGRRSRLRHAEDQRRLQRGPHVRRPGGRRAAARCRPSRTTSTFRSIT